MILTDRFAVIADIHGNACALRAVLDEIDALKIGTVLNLGDVFSGPLAAGETWELLRERDYPTLRGNHDRYLITQSRDEMAPSDRAALDELPAGALDWLRALPEVLDFGDVAACHATPGHDETYWLDTVNPGGVVHAAPRDRVEALLGGWRHGLVLCAHTHLPRAVRLGGQLIVNPGSVGCPAYDDTHPVPHVVETGTPDACFAILERRGTGWQVTHRAVPYDPGRMAARARAHGREGWARAVTTGWLEG